jgi:hypothetical protein
MLKVSSSPKTKPWLYCQLLSISNPKYKNALYILKRFCPKYSEVAVFDGYLRKVGILIQAIDELMSSGCMQIS